MNDVTIDCRNIEQTPYEKCREATQEWISENIEKHDLIQFLGSMNNYQHIRKLNKHGNFDQVYDKFRKSNTCQKFMFFALPGLPYLNTHLI